MATRNQARCRADLPPLTASAAVMLENLRNASADELAQLDSYRAELAAAPDDDATAADERLALAHFDAMRSVGTDVAIATSKDLHLRAAGVDVMTFITTTCRDVAPSGPVVCPLCDRVLRSDTHRGPCPGRRRQRR